MSVLEKRVDTAISSLREWITANRTEIGRAVLEGIEIADQSIRSDTGWRVPRERALRERRFERWIAPFRSALDAAIAESIHRRFAYISLTNASAAAELAMRDLPDEIRNRYAHVLDAQMSEAVRGIALGWTSRCISDGIAIGQPSWDGVFWTVPLHARRSMEKVGELLLDSDAEVRTDPEKLKLQVAGAL